MKKLITILVIASIFQATVFSEFASSVLDFSKITGSTSENNILGEPDAIGGGCYNPEAEITQVDSPDASPTEPGYIVVGFDNYFHNGPGDDITIYLYDFNSSDSFHVYVSQDGVNFTYVAFADYDVYSAPSCALYQISFDLEGTGVESAKYIKLVNDTVDGGTTNEGAEFDAVSVNQSCEVYKECFSLNPEWSSTKPNEVKWDNKGFYRANVTDTPSDLAQWGYSPVFEEVNGSFTFEFDMNPANPAWGTYPLIALIQEGAEDPYYDDYVLHVAMVDADDIDNQFELRCEATYIDRTPTFSVGQWYHHKLQYNAETQELIWLVSEVGNPNGSFYSNTYDSISLTAFNQIAAGYEGGAPSYGGYAEIYLDNISIHNCLLDNFEDNIINTSLWNVGGSKGGYPGPGSGNGEWDNVEMNGYLQAHSYVPTSGITYGAQAWTTTQKNFNDGHCWLINFTWSGDVLTDNGFHATEITDGSTNWQDGYYGDGHWNVAGTVQMYHELNTSNVGPYEWSIVIDKGDSKATLFEGPYGTGNVHSTQQLDDGNPWYLRFISAVATSAGFPEKTSNINLHDFSASVVLPKIVSPNGGEELISGQVHTLEWNANVENETNVILEYSTNTGNNWTQITVTENDGSYNWTLPDVTSNQCLVRITGQNDPWYTDTSDELFAIYECQLDSWADSNNDCKVNMIDFAAFCDEWLKNGNPFDYELYKYNGHHYALSISSGTWEQIEAEAVDAGGHLVTINDEAENNWIDANFPRPIEPISYYWIGLYQIPGSNEPADGWVWVSSEPVTYLNWGTYEPNNQSPGEDFAVITDSELNHWNDWGPEKYDFVPIKGIIEFPW